MTPADTAKNEAAKQAVLLAFGLLTMLIMMPIYKRMADQMAARQTETLTGLLRSDPALDQIKQAETARTAALEAAKRWDRLASVLFTFGTQRSFWWAHDKAEKARAAYEAERP